MEEKISPMFKYGLRFKASLDKQQLEDVVVAFNIMLGMLLEKLKLDSLIVDISGCETNEKDECYIKVEINQIVIENQEGV